MRHLNLLHRAVYVLVVDAAARLLVHRRAGWKDVWPGRWGVAFGGVAAVGEPAGATAMRELAEEAGVDAPLEHLGAGRYEDGDVRVIGDVFLARTDGPFMLADGEVVEAGGAAPSGRAGRLAAHEVCPDSVAIALPLLEAAWPSPAADRDPNGPVGAGDDQSDREA